MSVFRFRRGEGLNGTMNIPFEYVEVRDHDRPNRRANDQHFHGLVKVLEGKIEGSGGESRQPSHVDSWHERSTERR